MSLIALVEQLPFDDIVRFEVRRHGWIVGLDSEDVLQEMRTLVHTSCVPRLGKANTGRAYVRRSLRNALATLHRNATTAGRQPRDARGREAALEPYEDSTAPHPTPEAMAEAAELGRMLRKIPKNDREVLASVFIDGVRKVTASEVEAARARAEELLTTLLGEKTMTPTPQRATTDIPDCHAEGAEPIGYETDVAEAQQCQDCTDKFTCLPAGIRSGLLKGVTLSIDPEVLAGFRGIVPVKALRERLVERTKLRDAKKEIPERLRFDTIPGVMDVLAKADTSIKTVAVVLADDDDDEEDDTTPDDNKEQMMTKKSSKVKPASRSEAKESPKKASKPKAQKAAAKPKVKSAKKVKPKREAPANRLGEKGTFKYQGKPKERDDGSIELPNGRTVPAPKEITPEKMELALSRLNGKLGLDFDLEVGMTLKQIRRDGDPIVIKITKQGFDYDGEKYASLSGACMAATLRSVSGVEMFNFEKHSNIEVSGKNVPGGSYAKAKAEIAEAPKAKKKPKAKAKKSDEEEKPKAKKKPKADKPPKAKKKSKVKAAPEPEPEAEESDDEEEEASDEEDADDSDE